MLDPLKQAMIDAKTWVPVAFFSWIQTHAEFKNGEAVPHLELHQLWVSALGLTEWRKIETRNLTAMVKAYAECQAFNDRTSDPDDLSDDGDV